MNWGFQGNLYPHQNRITSYTLLWDTLYTVSMRVFDVKSHLHIRAPLHCRKSCANWTVVNLHSLIYLWIEFKMKSTIHILHYILAFKYRENTIIQSESTFNAVKPLLKLFPQTWVQIFYKVHVILNVFLSYTETDSLPKQIYSLVCEMFAQKHANLIHFFIALWIALIW